MRSLRSAVVLCIVLGGCATTLRSPARVDPAALVRLDRFPTADWARVLSEHVDEAGRVDYRRLRLRRAPLDRFVALLAAVGPRNRPELFPRNSDRLAYYLDAYNALVVFQVLERWPLASVRDDMLRFFYWTRFVVDGEEISLYELENELVRPRFRDPRVHFALNCASRGCPRLPRTPFSGSDLSARLEEETQRFLHEERNVRLQGDVVRLSEIFSWYAEDFPPTPLEWIRRHAPDLDLPARADVTYVPYDWRLNAQESP